MPPYRTDTPDAILEELIQGQIRRSGPGGYQPKVDPMMDQDPQVGAWYGWGDPRSNPVFSATRRNEINQRRSNQDFGRRMQQEVFNPFGQGTDPRAKGLFPGILGEILGKLFG